MFVKCALTFGPFCESLSTELERDCLDLGRLRDLKVEGSTKHCRATIRRIRLLEALQKEHRFGEYDANANAISRCQWFVLGQSLHIITHDALY